MACMEINGLSEDMLAWFESQLRGTLEATQRLLAQLEAHRKSMKAGARSSLPMSAPQPLPEVPKLANAAPAASEVQRVGAEQPPYRTPPNPGIVVPEAVTTLSGDFGIAAIRKILKGQGYYSIPDGTIRRSLQEMVAKGELILTSTNTGRGGNKYRRVNQET